MGLRELTPEMAKKAKEELGEDPTRTAQDIQHIKDWATKQPHLKARLDDQWILSFLRGCKFSLEKTKEKFDTFYTSKTTFPELMANKDPLDPISNDVMKLGIVVPLPELSDPLAPRVFIFRPGGFDPSQYKMLDVMKVAQMMHYINMLEDDALVVSGEIYVCDLANVGIGHLTQATPNIMKKLATINQEAMPVRQKGYHYINTPPGMETVFNLIKALLNEKNRSRLYVHKNVDALFAFVPQAILPKEYGGDAGPIQDIIDYWKAHLESHRVWFLEDEQYGTDESKRLGSPRTAESMFGVEGSFRQMNFD